jgi:hypothetical protein
VGWMGRVCHAHSVEVADSEGSFTDRGCSPQAFATFQGTVDETRLSDVTNVGEVWFELVANPREVGVNGGGFDMMAHIDCV